MAAPAPHLVVFSNLEVLPSLRGTVFRDGGSVVIEGQWAMKDSDFAIGGQSSPFRLTKKSDLVENITPFCDMVLSGTYEGQLHLKKLNSNGVVKVDEKMTLYFEKAAVEASGETPTLVGENNGERTIRGDGKNKFGSFMLKGQLSTGVNAHFYRQYVVPVGGTPKASKKKSSNKSSSGVKRDSSSSSSSKRKAAPAYVAPPMEPTVRTQRISQHLIRCGDLIKELKRLPASVYFSEPVDPVKLNIPEYTEVIKKPMDFSTVAKNITNVVYETPLNYAEDMRLVFKNAITFNQMKDNPVHIAARDMSAIFEQKFAALNLSMQSKQGVTAAELAAFSQRVPKPAKKKSSSRRSSAGGGGGGGSRAGYTGKQAALPPDGSYAVMQEMQQRMMDMANEIQALRGSVVEPVMFDEGPALTLTEKKRLIDDLGLLGPDEEDTMFEIIAEENDITDGEMDINLIKTSTLRRLQEFVAGIKAAQKVEQDALKASNPPPAKKTKTESLSQPAQSIVIPSTAIAVADPLSAFAATSPSMPISGTGDSGGGRERAYSLDLPDYGAMLSDNIHEDAVQLASGDAWVPKEQSEEVRGGSSVTKELMKDEWGQAADLAKAKEERG